MSHQYRLALGFVVAAWVVSASSSADTHYVNKDNGSPVAPYTNWVTAAKLIHEAIAEASAGDTVLVTNGEYKIDNDAKLILINSALDVKSVNGPSVTIINGNGSRPCARINDWGARLSGFHCKNGKVTAATPPLPAGHGPDGGGISIGLFGGTVSNCVIDNCLVDPLLGDGGGVHSAWSLGAIESCTIVGCTADDGGGVYFENGGTIRDSIVSNCIARVDGAGILVREQSLQVTVDNCVVVGNAATDDGGGVYMWRDGTPDNSRVVNTVLRGNSAVDKGAAVYFDNGGTLGACEIYGSTGGKGGLYFSGDGRATNCLLNGNAMTTGTAYLDGGGLLRNCLVTENTVTADGGGAYFEGGGGIVGNCTIVSNSAGRGGGVATLGGGLVRNSIVYFNTATLGDNFSEQGSGMTIIYTCITPDPGGFNVITSDPGLASWTTGDYQLSAASPCRDIGATNVWMSDATDFTGTPRVINGVVDLGAYEYSNSVLEADFRTDTPIGLPPLAVVLTAVPGGTNLTGLTYWWDIDNDGTNDFSGAGVDVVTNVYSNVGSYTVSLTISNAVGEVDTEVKTNYITMADTAFVYVDPDGSDTYPYTNWATAAHTFQDALAAAVDGTLVSVDGATYQLDAAGVQREIRVDKAVTVRGVDGAATTIVDGRQKTYRCFHITHPDAVVEGFTIKKGIETAGGGVLLEYGGTVRDCIIRESEGVESGGGALLYYGGLLDDCEIFGNSTTITNSNVARGGGVTIIGSGTVRDCNIHDNSSFDRGGGVYLDSGGIVTDCVVHANAALREGGGIYIDDSGFTYGTVISNNTARYGGGAYLEIGGVLWNCAVADNLAQTTVAGEGRDGGGVYIQSSGTILDSLVANNNALRNGGGVELDDGGSVNGSMIRGNVAQNAATLSTSDRGGGGVMSDGWGDIRDCSIISNTTLVGDNGDGGGIYFWNSIGQAENCLIFGNTAGVDGGGVYINDAGMLENCTIADNNADPTIGNGGGIYCADGGLVRATIVYSNSAASATVDNYFNLPSVTPPAYHFTCVTPVLNPAFFTDLGGNISTNPLFAAPSAGNYRLSLGSSCIDPITNVIPGRPVFDLDEVPRPLDGDNVPPAGFDMGAYEFIHPDADTDADGMPDWWEVAFGLNPIDPLDADDDEDGDGWDNLSEYLAGSHVLNPCSFPLPELRQDLDVAVYDELIYIAGGTDGTNAMTNFWVFTPTNLTYTNKAPLPAPRAGLRLLTVSTNIYAIGGTSNSNAVATAYCYDPASDVWTNVADMGTARANFAAAVGANGQIYVFGGEDNGTATNTAEVYDPGTDSWAPLTNLPYAAYGMQAETAFDGRIVIFGAGEWISATNQAPRDDVLIYDPTDDSFSFGAGMSTSRGFLAMAPFGPYEALALGGESPVTNAPPVTNLVDAYSRSTDTWNISLTNRLLYARARHAAAVVSNTVYVFGGDSGSRALSDAEKFTPTSYTLTASAGDHGSIVPSGAVPSLAGSDHEFRMVPDTYYTVSNVTVDAASVGVVTTYTFSAVGSNHTIHVEFSTTNIHDLVVVSVHALASPPVGTNVFWVDTVVTAMVTNVVAVGVGTQYVASGWIGTGSVPAIGATTNTGPFAIQTNSTIEWLWQTNFWLDVESTNGTTDVTDSWIATGTVVAVTASNNPGYTFTNWTGDVPPGSETNISITVTMTAPRQVVAHFFLDTDGDGIPNAVDPDDDNDCMTDVYEIMFGLNPTNAADAAIDSDGDTVINVDEFVSYTDPTNALSFLAIEAISNLAGRSIYFLTATQRVYTLQVNLDLRFPAAWTNVPGQVKVPGSGGMDSLLDTNEPSDGRSYRVEVELP